MIISQNILKIMEQKHITQKKLADYTGISTSAISDWKKKGTNPSVDKIGNIADCLGVSVDYLLGRVSEPNNIQSTKHQDQITAEMLKAFDKLSFKDKIAVLNYTLNIENQTPIVQSKPRQAEPVQQAQPQKPVPQVQEEPQDEFVEVNYVARDLTGQNTKGKLRIRRQDLIDGEAEDYNEFN